MKKTGILMCKDKEIAKIKYDTDNYYIYNMKILNDINLFPISTIDNENNIIKIKELRTFLKDRAIPDSRSHFDKVKKKLNITNKYVLSETSFALSLSDQYWINPVNILGKGVLNWNEVNFFTNKFTDDVGKLFFDEQTPQEIELKDPVNTSEGNLCKKWTLSNNKIYLIKSSETNYSQEVYNEKFISLFLKSLNIDCIEYDIGCIKTKNNTNIPVSICECICNENKSIVSFEDFWVFGPERSRYLETAYFDSILDNICTKIKCDKNVLDDYFDKILLIDYILMNEDRHANNIIFIRELDNPTKLIPGPIFDNGNSLLFDTKEINQEFFDENHSVLSHFMGCESFEQMINKIKHIENINLDNIDFHNIFDSVYEKSNIPKERLEALKIIINKRINLVKEYQQEIIKYNNKEEIYFEKPKIKRFVIPLDAMILLKKEGEQKNVDNEILHFDGNR